MVWEMRVYTFEPRSILEIIYSWTKAIPYRDSSLAAMMYTGLGALNRGSERVASGSRAIAGVPGPTQVVGVMYHFNLFAL